MMGTLKAIKRKLNSKKGFTIAEMLVAIIILLMVSAIMVSGIPVAKNAYEKVVLTSNAEILMSTAVSALRSELGTARVEDCSDNEIVYYNSARGTTSRINGGSSDIMIQRYYSNEGLSRGSQEVELISSEESTKDLHVTFGGVDYNESNGVISITDLTVSHNDDSLLKRDVSIRVLLQEKITE